jgi:L-ribulokinase
MWHTSFGGLPSEEFLSSLDPLLKGIRARLFNDTFTSDISAGTLCTEWAARLGLSDKVVVGVGAFDAHMGAVGAQIEPYYLSKVMGTSTCDMLVAPASEIGDKVIRGICGQVDGSIIPGMLGMEAGQSAFGDVYAWFRKVLMWPVMQLAPGIKGLDESARKMITEELSSSILKSLEREAAQLPVGESGEIALDWFNGRRTPDADQSLTGLIAGLNLGSDAPRLYRALVESTAFGAKKIVDRFESEGIPIKGVIALGGVAKKSPFVMQTVSDVFNKKIKVARSEQACALGAAMFAAVAAGVFSSVSDAQNAMGNGFEHEYTPNSANSALYMKNYKRYSKLASFFEKERVEE